MSKQFQTWFRTWIACGILLGLAGFGAAQQKPDFSGAWTLNRQASTLSPAAAPVQSGIVRIEHRDPTFRYRASFVTPNGPLQYEYELQSDGREVGAIQNGVTTLSNLRWEGEALVVRSRVQRPDGEVRITFRYELINEGNRLRATEQIRGAGQPQDNVWIFDR
jgi:hypothetical protein